MSLSVFTGGYYDFIPEEFAGTIKRSADGRLLPREYECHLRSPLHCGLDQSRFLQRLPNPAERFRTDLWWVERDGSNVEEVVEDILQRFLRDGLPCFERLTDISAAYNAIQQEEDCYDKFSRIVYFAKYLGYEEAYRDYAKRLRQEAHRMGKRPPLSED